MSKTNPAPKELTLRQAIEESKKPASRLGDLICVQDFRQYRNGVMMRSIFAPEMSHEITGKKFRQPETEEYLRKLYSEGGRIESVAHFSCEALALCYDYSAGVICECGIAGSVGDPRQFVADFKDALAMFPKVSPEIAAIVRKTTLLQHQRHLMAAREGERDAENQSQRAKKPRRVKNEEGTSLAEVIASLKRNNPPDTKPSELWPHLKARIEEWSGSECNETKPNEKDWDSWVYTFTKPCSDTKDTITGQTFRKALRRLRTGN